MADSKNNQLITDANKAFYALTAAEYDKMGRGMAVEAAKTNAANILARVPGIDPTKTELMDFAAGTGLLAMFLAPRCKSVTALDQSDAMIEQLRNKLDAQTDPKDRINNIVPVVTDILDEALSDGPLDGKKFDVITCTNSYHHLNDPKKVTQVLASYLKPGGYLAVVDLIKTERSAEFHTAPKTAMQEDGSHKYIVEFGVEPSGQHVHHGDDGHHEHKHHDHHGHSHGHELSSGQATHHHEHVIAHKGGFSEAEMDDFFSAAQLKLVNIGKSVQFVKDGKAYDNFLAIAQKSE
ncbi:hypothetical protein EX895_000573 [Sporisorium graminicola]|uniref:Methyltransferase type 12 domain-containing protein n=1 Tax=Sporisorium graminicola TaxID=280036 RepID=A0A4U7L0B9_9BASI|nr:hypothetical protein EX895_000573 [Sporisorium graminicola]TKY90575.1 hypothetical protein EX895_000573 [Sporisorium graminicola]